ncbi:meckelin isoform X2 [Odontomachus brunneus]|uniref:meckelin isoform X2 n=1 Tax=Odontomachus brunneus TaxID=486640 RepID=UPI0013F2A5FF|nr:meckelin isoform X2 [Odontomachus brunneus]
MNCIRDSCNRYATLIAIILPSFAGAINVNNDVLEYWIPSSCRYDEYFDTLSLSCSRCNASRNLEPATNRKFFTFYFLMIYLSELHAGLQCTCNIFSRTIGYENGNPLCAACGPDMIATADGRECILRPNATCKCSSNQIRLDRNVNGILLDTVLCVTCVQGTYPSVDCSKCLPCDGREYSGRANCVCPSATHVRLRNYCLRKDDVADWPDVRSTYLMKFQSENVDSYYLRSELQVAVHLCKRKDRMACEHLSNICALTLYTDGIACMLFMHTPLAPVWLFYSKQDTVSILNDTKITERYSLRRGDNSSILDFAIAKFSLNGKFLSIGRPSLPCQLLRNVRFGVNYNKKCKTTAIELLNAQVELLSPYLIFKDGNKSFTHSLPVIVKSAGENIGEILQQQLVRKFFLVDNVSGFKTLPTFMNIGFAKASELSVLRYMKSLTILVNVQNGEEHGKIFAPFLIVQYDELTQQDLLNNPDVVIEYKVTFTLKDSDVDYNVQITIGVLTGVALIFSTIRAGSYYKRNHNGNLSITVLLWFLVYAMGAVGNVITFVCISACVYLFVFYKGQTVPYILLPGDTNEKRIQIYISVAFSFKIVEMIGFICQHWDLSIFFVDWEQPRTIHNQVKYDSPHTSLRKLYANRFPRSDGASTRISSDIIASKRKKRLRKTDGNASPSGISKSSATDKYAPDFSSVCSLSRSPLQEAAEHNYTHNLPISVWRTYFVANEWCKLQTKRRINVALQSIYTLCVLQIFDLESWMLAVPEANVADKSEVKNNFTLQYAICTFVYISVYFIQWLIRIMFYERYIRNRLQKFVDLCSVANISVLILAHNYYGFYIHGRSVHGYADTDLPTLINDLKKEEDNLCAHRGLVPGTTEQTFIVSLTQSFKSLYDELMKQKDNGNIGAFRSSETPSKSWKQLNEIRSKVRIFLTQFLDHCSESEDYIIKEQHILEKLCDVFFQDAKDKSVFYIDNNYSFNRVILYGNEWLLATFEITVFAFFLALYGTYVLACITTVLVSQLFLIIIRFNVKRNLCNKSLLDKRFLM